jgi:hypothetical protein
MTLQRMSATKTERLCVSEHQLGNKDPKKARKAKQPKQPQPQQPTRQHRTTESGLRNQWGKQKVAAVEGDGELMQAVPCDAVAEAHVRCWLQMAQNSAPSTTTHSLGRQLIFSAKTGFLKSSAANTSTRGVVQEHSGECCQME